MIRNTDRQWGVRNIKGSLVKNNGICPVAEDPQECLKIVNQAQMNDKGKAK